jgi:hypothetical protein
MSEEETMRPDDDESSREKEPMVELKVDGTGRSRRRPYPVRNDGRQDDHADDLWPDRERRDTR